MSELVPFRDPETAMLFAPLRAGLLELLSGLGPDDWDHPTVARAWRVRDVAAHLLDGELRTLAAHRDGHALAPGEVIRGYDDIVALIQRLNAEGVVSGRHLSPRLLIDLLEISGRWMSEFVTSLDPDAPALFAVAWAGEVESTNRFDTAREYTERWHHEMQIRLALVERGRPGVLLAARYALPLFATAMRVLPHAYRSLDAAEGTTLTFAVTHRDDAPDARWSLEGSLCREHGVWRLYEGAAAAPTARINGSADTWWRLFFNALAAADASRAFAIDGAHALAAPLWHARSVMV